MKHLLLIFVSMLLLSSCGKDDPWNPEDDKNDFLGVNPYGVVFENATDGDLYITSEGLFTQNVIILRQGDISDEYHSSKSYITISYSGEGTYWTKKTKGINLVKDEVIHYTITYP